MLGKILTEENKELLKLIYSYGGYIRVAHLRLLFPYLSHDGLLRKLDKLKTMRYLTSRRLRTESKREAPTYQVTQAACKLFGNPDSYFRKTHSPEYAYRALLKSWFCCEIYETLRDNIITDNDEKIEIFESGNFAKKHFPVKINKETSFIHFEELIIDLRKCEGKNLVCNDEVLYSDKESNVVIVYIDQYYKDINKQLVTNILNRYNNLIRAGGDFKINLLIVTDNKDRTELYKKRLNKLPSQLIFHGRASDESIKVYSDFLLRYHKEDQAKIDDLNEKINSGEFKSGLYNKYKNIRIELMTETHKEFYNSYMKDGIEYIIQKIVSLVEEYGNVKKAYSSIEDVFHLLFIFEHYSYISYKVYETQQKIYE